jgi:hypothetical protein
LLPKGLIVTVTTALLAAGASSASTLPKGAQSPARATVTTYSVPGYFNDVVAVSGNDAWAVGWTASSPSKTIMAHWDGQKWSPVAGVNGLPGALMNLTVVSRTDIWAAGYAATSKTTSVPLVMHWTGAGWHRIPGVPSVNGYFTQAAEAGGNLLAVGAMNAPPMLNMERTGTTWKKLPVPSTPGELTNLVVTGTKNAWAAGVTGNTSTGNLTGDVLLRWNGNTWRGVSFPLHGTNQELWQLAAGPGGAVWAVGYGHNHAFTGFTPISMLWTGTAWRKVTVPAPTNSMLGGVAFVPGGTAWAVGASHLFSKTFTVRWTGAAWQQVASPNPFAAYSSLTAVAASSKTDAWAVGYGANTATGAPRTFILHWNGHAWK